MRYNKSETRIINNAIKMAEEVKKYHERTQSWDCLLYTSPSPRD